MYRDRSGNLSRNGYSRSNRTFNNYEDEEPVRDSSRYRRGAISSLEYCLCSEERIQVPSQLPVNGSVAPYASSKFFDDNGRSEYSRSQIIPQEEMEYSSDNLTARSTNLSSLGPYPSSSIKNGSNCSKFKRRNQKDFYRMGSQPLVVGFKINASVQTSETYFTTCVEYYTQPKGQTRAPDKGSQRKVVDRSLRELEIPSDRSEIKSHVWLPEKSMVSNGTNTDSMSKKSVSLGGRSKLSRIRSRDPIRRSSQFPALSKSAVRNISTSYIDPDKSSMLSRSRDPVRKSSQFPQRSRSVVRDVSTSFIGSDDSFTPSYSRDPVKMSSHFAPQSTSSVRNMPSGYIYPSESKPYYKPQTSKYCKARANICAQRFKMASQASVSAMDNKSTSFYSSSELVAGRRSKVYENLKCKCFNTKCLQKAIKRFVREAIEESLRESVSQLEIEGSMLDQRAPSRQHGVQTVPSAANGVMMYRSEGTSGYLPVPVSDTTCGCVCVCNPEEVKSIRSVHKTDRGVNGNLDQILSDMRISKPTVSIIDPKIASIQGLSKYSEHHVGADCNCCQISSRTRVLCSQRRARDAESQQVSFVENESLLDTSKHGIFHKTADDRFETSYTKFPSSLAHHTHNGKQKDTHKVTDVGKDPSMCLLQQGNFQTYLMRKSIGIELPKVTEEELALINEYMRTTPMKSTSSVTIDDKYEKYHYPIDPGTSDKYEYKRLEDLSHVSHRLSDDTLDYRLLRHDPKNDSQIVKEKPPTRKRASIAPDEASEDYHKQHSIGDEEKKIIEQVRSEHQKKLMESLKADEEKELQVTEASWIPGDTITGNLETSDSLDKEVASIEEQQIRYSGEPTAVFENIIKQEKKKLRRSSQRSRIPSDPSEYEEDKDHGRKSSKGFFSFFKNWRSGKKDAKRKEAKLRSLGLSNEMEDDISESISGMSASDLEEREKRRSRRSSMSSYKDRPAGHFRQNIYKFT
ncbi:unnamed protein product [Diabrotica balteata]|uniref:Uncharacterized protein n=1 Tax=Diabrotica balteata TaxID=107213 RepID=A0A9N9T4Z4_DIABA|nr:unnamed protein product [Diabrotica balteata]